MSSLFRYVALGDSTAVGIGSNEDGGYPERLYRKLKAAGVNAGIKNLGISGATSVRLLQGPVQKAVELRPALVTLGIGSNDLWRMVPMPELESNLKSILDQLATTQAQVVMSNLVDLSLAPVASMIEMVVHVPKQVFVDRIDALNAMIAAVAKRPNVTLVDLCALSRAEKDQLHQWFSDDGFHPSSLGYDRWAEALWPAVEAVSRQHSANAPIT